MKIKKVLKICIKISYICFVLLYTLLHTSGAEEIVIVGHDNNAPFLWRGESGKPEGSVVEILNYIETTTVYRFNYQLYPWKRAYTNAEKGNGAIVGISKNTERLAIFDYSDLLYYHDIVLVVLKGDEFNYKTIGDLHGKRVAVHRGSTYNDDYQEAVKTGSFESVNTNSREQRLAMLLEKRVDVALIGGGRVGLCLAIGKDSNLLLNKDRFSMLPTPLMRDKNYLAILKQLNKTQFISEFNTALKQGRESGKFEEINRTLAESYLTPPVK